MKLDEHFVEAGLKELLLVILFTIFTFVGWRKPDILTYLFVAYTLICLAAVLYAVRVRRERERIKKEHEAKEQARKLAEGVFYKNGEQDARGDIATDIARLGRGSNITVCGTGATAVLYIAPEIYEAIKRGVNVEVFVLHPNDELVNRVAEIEHDLENRVFLPMVRQLQKEPRLRERLGADWCDKTVKILEGGSEVCSLHREGHATCSLHSRVICTSADIWKRVAERVHRNDPEGEESHGHLSVRAYRRIPLLKAWRFRPNSGDAGQDWYYVADYIYHSGVGVNNPMHRVDKRYVDYFVSDENDSALINIDRVDEHLKQISQVCDKL